MKIDLHIEYPGLTPAEQQRIGEAILRAVRHAAVCAACGQVKDGTPENGYEGDFIRSQHLDVSASLTLDPVAGPNDPPAVVEPEHVTLGRMLGNQAYTRGRVCLDSEDEKAGRKEARRNFDAKDANYGFAEWLHIEYKKPMRFE